MSDKATDKRPQYFMVEDAVVEKFNLDPYTGWLYIIIVKHADRQTGEAFPGIARLCKMARMSRSQVMRAIKELEEKHLIRVERDTLPLEGEKRQRGVNHYFLLSASGSAYQTLGVVSSSDYPNSSQTLGVVSGVDCNKNQVEPESINHTAPVGADVSTVSSKPISKKKSKSYADVDSKEIDARIYGWIKAFDKAPLGNNYGNETNRKLAAEMVRGSITAEQVESYTRHLLKQTFYRDKSPTFDYVARNINAWLPKQASILQLEPVVTEEWDVNTFLRTGKDSA